MRTCKCGVSLEDICHGKQIGCANCYSVFREEIIASIQPVQLRDAHEGKQPSKLWKLEVNKLQRRMDRAVERDEFEKAADIKAQIQSITQRHQRSD